MGYLKTVKERLVLSSKCGGKNKTDQKVAKTFWWLQGVEPGGRKSHPTGRKVLKNRCIQGAQSSKEGYKTICRLRYKRGGVGTSSGRLPEEGCVLESNQRKTFSVLETEQGSHACMTNTLPPSYHADRQLC